MEIEQVRQDGAGDASCETDFYFDQIDIWRWAVRRYPAGERVGSIRSDRTGTHFLVRAGGRRTRSDNLTGAQLAALRLLRREAGR